MTSADGTLSNLKGSGTSYTATFTAKAGVDDTHATVSVTSGSYHDADGNAGSGGSTAPFTVDTVAPTIASITTSGAGITHGNGDLDAGKVVELTVDFSKKVTVSGHPVLKLNDGGVASYTKGSGTTALTFTYTVAAGQKTPDLTVTGLELAGGATIKDAAGNNAVLSGAVTNPAGVLQIDTKPPTITSITTSGAGITHGNGDLDAGKVVELTVDFSKKVTVSGHPVLKLNDGGVASYTKGSGTTALTFTYTVAAGQNTPDLTVTGLELAGGATIKDAAGNNAVLSGAVTNPAGVLQIDTKPPTIASITTSGAGITHGNGDLDAGKVVELTVDFSKKVTVSGHPVLKLNDGGVASYTKGSGTTALTFTYTVAAGQNTPDLTVTGLELAGGATIKDAAGNNAVLSGAVTNPAGVLQIDTKPPTIASITTSGAGITHGNGDLDAGKVVELTVDFSKKVTVSGHPVLKLNDGGVASYTKGSGTTALTFTYTVAAGQNTPDLTVTGLELAGGATIKDAAGNNAVLSGAVTNPAGVLQIDTKPPTIASITTSGAGITHGNGDLDAGKVVELTVDFSKKVTVSGHPVLKLNDGGVASYTKGSGTTALTFTYTVAAGQNTPDLTVTGLELAGGATIKDAAGNNAVLSGAVTNPAGVLQIDTKPPTIASITTSGAGITHGNGDLDAGKVVELTVDFSKKVTVSGHPVLKLNDGGVASYTKGSGTTALTFTYTVAAGQNTPDLTVTGLELAGGATIKDAAGNNAVLSGAVTNPAGVLQIDTKPPTIASITTSGAGITHGNGDLDAGKVVELTVDFSKKVTVSGHPVLKLNDGGVASYTKGSGTTALTFTYTVAAGQNTPDLTVTGLELAGGATIKDAAGNNAVLSGAVTNPAGVLQIDTKPPTVTEVVTSPTSGEVISGQTVRITLDMSEKVSAGGLPTLLLNDGGVASYDAAHSTNTTLSFDYTVAAGQLTTDLAVTGVDLPSGAAIKDLAGNKAVLSGAGVNLGLEINTKPLAVNGSTDLELLGPSNANAVFGTGSTGTFTLDDLQAFTGTVAGFAPGTHIDLADIGFGAATTLGYAPNPSATEGVLTASDGTHTAKLALLGQYMASSFVASSDGHGGTLISDPPQAMQHTLSLPHA